MKRFGIAVAAAVAILAGGMGTANAQMHGGGGSHGGGGWQGGGGGGGWHGGGGGGWHGSSWHGGWYGGYRYGGSAVVVGFGFPGYYWPGYYPYGYSYGYPYPYYDGYYSAPVYASPGAGAYNPGPVEYMEKDYGDAPSAASTPSGAVQGGGEYSYYCTDPAGFYPKVPNCSKPWLKVVPDGSATPRPR